MPANNGVLVAQRCDNGFRASKLLNSMERKERERDKKVRFDAISKCQVRRTELSRPRVMSIMKKRSDQNVDPGMVAIASG